MSVRSSASRYARALLDVAIKESNPEHAEQELAAFVDLLTGHRDLEKALTNPAVPVTAKRAVVEDLVTRQDPSRPVAKLLLMLADRDRLLLLPALLAVYRERLMDYRLVVRADVTTAAPLAPDRTAQLERRLADVTGRRVVLTTKVDPSIIGGIVARIGSTVYDGSIITQLAKIRERLTERS
jgi:F-type H+-transporting ATPase subunit delta